MLPFRQSEEIFLDQIATLCAQPTIVKPATFAGKLLVTEQNHRIAEMSFFTFSQRRLQYALWGLILSVVVVGGENKDGGEGKEELFT